MEHQDLLNLLQHVGRDPSRLIFVDELTDIYNRRFLLNYLQYKVRWDSLESQPLSLLMMDTDYFKQINDSHGHDVGDQVLIRVARLIQEAGGENGLAVRYGGDEFMILMPGTDKKTALKVGEQLIHQVHQEGIWLEKTGNQLHITLSIGIATAPNDAQGSDDLIQKADTALYYAKKSGRDRLADASEISLEDVFAKTTVYQLDRDTISGRKSQLGTVTEAFKKFSRGESQFLVIEGGNGMGKTEFLRAIRLNLADSETWQTEVQGNPQEAFRPYYLTANILIEIMNHRPGKGTDILDNLSPKEINLLSRVLPQLGDPEDSNWQEELTTQREELFAVLVHFIPQLLDFRPLILLIDDLDCSDEATLLLLRQLLLRKDFPLFLCGTANKIEVGRGQGEPSPLESLYANHHHELEIVRVSLSPLTAADISQHLESAFPHLRLPENLAADLAELTRGNPLFISEIRRKLVLDGKIHLTGQNWVIEPLEPGYLPKSLEEIVSQKIATFDAESRQLLDQASAFGENVSMSMLTGTSETRETKVLEFIDQALAQGLISTDYRMNDETIRFLSKHILQVTYDAIQEDQKRTLHERIGNYQENLFSQRLLSSAAPLAYHFQLSADQDKARRYRELQQAHDDKIFDSEEAIYYTGDLEAETKLRILDPVDRDTLVRSPEVMAAMLESIEKIRLSPSGSRDAGGVSRRLKRSIDRILQDNKALHFTRLQGSVAVNGEPANVAEHKPVAQAFVALMSRLGLRGVAFFQGLTERELTVMLEALGRMGDKRIDWRFWERFAEEQGLVHVELKPVSLTAGARTGGTPAVPVIEDADQEEESAETSVPQDDPDPEDVVAESGADLPDQIVEKPEVLQLRYSSDDSAQETLRELLLRGDEDQARHMIGQFSLGFERQTLEKRTQVMDVFGGLLGDLTIVSQPRLVELLTEPLLLLCVKENDLGLVWKMNVLISQTATHLIQFGDYKRASRLLTRLRKLQQRFQERDGKEGVPTGTFFTQDLDQKTQQLILDDLRSQEPTRMQEATQLLASLGERALPLLIEVVKEEDDLRLRQIACQLAGDLGSEATQLLKSELVLEGFTEQRARILEVIDTATRDLKKELVYALEDRNPRVLRATFGLIERLRDEQLTAMLFDYVDHEDSTIAVAAIESLGKIKPEGTVKVLVSLLDSVKETERLVASCNSLGQIADRSGVEPLAKIMAGRGFLWFRKKSDPVVRAAAALAMSQISSPRVNQILARYLQDPDRRVRQIAQDKLNSSNLSNSN